MGIKTIVKTNIIPAQHNHAHGLSVNTRMKAGSNAGSWNAAHFEEEPHMPTIVKSYGFGSIANRVNHVNLILITVLCSFSASGQSNSGGLSVVAALSGPEVSICLPGRPCSGDVWKDVPGLSTSVHSRAGDNLAITVSGEIDAPATVWFRALIDGTAASPSDVTFKTMGDFSDGVRSFTFIRVNVSSGRHVVQIQWFAHQTWPSRDDGPPPGTTPQIGDRTLTVLSASPTSGDGRLVAVAAPSSADIVKTSALWEDVPNLSTVMSTSAMTDLEITFSAESAADRGRFFARAVVDGQSDSDVLFDNSASSSRSGTRAFTFVKKALPAGPHTISVQWYAQDPGASIRVGDRTMTVFASLPGAGSGLAAAAVQSAPLELPARWHDVPNLGVSFNTSEPSTNIRIAWGAEMSVQNGRIFLRALVDGMPADPSDVVVVSSGAEFRAQSFNFVQKNLLPGMHSVQIQSLVDAGATGLLADRFLSVLFERRDGGDFGQPYPRVSDASDTLKPRFGTFPLVVICFDPGRPSQTAPTNAQLKNQLLGADGNTSVAGWFGENSGGAFRPDPIILLGCDDNHWFKPPSGREGNWYWDNSAFPQLRQDAIAAADPAFDFHSYDRNGDNHLAPDEVVVAVLVPQNGTDGFFRRFAASAAVDGISKPLDFDILDIYFSAATSDSARRLNVGLVSHETSHAVLSAADMYTDDKAGYSGFTTSPQFYSLMDNHFNANNLDPFHKLKSAFLTPDLAEINTWLTQRVNLSSVETSGRVTIVYDPARKDSEYFILENRWGGSSSAPDYDSTLPSQGLAVWHIVQDLDLANRYPPPGKYPAGMDEWGRLGVRFLGVLSTAGANMNLMWADGTSSGIRVTLESAPDEVVNVEIANTSIPSSAPDLQVTKSHQSDFRAGQTGAQYTIQVFNMGSGPTTGTVKVVDTLPLGLTATDISGRRWICDLPTLSCTTSNAIAPSTSLVFTVTVNVAANAPSSVTNTVTVSGGGDINTSNNTAADRTNILR
jgi:M6 family metalloprotease-like protein